MKKNNLPEDVPKDLLYMSRVYNWLYSKYVNDLQAAAMEGNKECLDLIDKINIAINTIEHWQLDGDFGRAHYEVERMKAWFNPIIDLEY